ncbi:MAG TPA: heavy metal translocating P-type ATPase [Chloroflexi bacterium]|nr:heavy metal translocating P-type ATPase [Chloroflexota bacterium]
MISLHSARSALRAYPLPIVALAGLSLGLLAAAVRSDTSHAVLGATLAIGGLPVVFRTVKGMIRGNFASDVVASLAIVGAAATDEYLAGCVIVLMQTGGEALDDYAIRRASASLDALMSRAPHVAHRLSGAKVEDLPVSEIITGDTLLVRPGEIVPVDGLVISGNTALDESAITGEPIPVAAGPGREVMSGSISQDGALEIRALRPSSESQYEQIVALVRAAEQDKAPIGRLADRYAIFFTPFTLAMCGLAWLFTREAQSVVAVLVVATPCPLILATPVAIISGINRAARRGIVVKGGAAIEQIGRADVVVFDKTGTLTTGSPVVERAVPLDGYEPREVVRLAAGLEQLSSHPMARALVAEGKLASGSLPMPTEVIEEAGLGVSGKVEGHVIDVGSIAFAAQKSLASLDALRGMRTERFMQDEATAVVGIDGRAAGLVLYSDPLRSNVPQTLARLKGLGVRDTVMLTGDDVQTAAAIATQAGIDDVRADLLPGGKVQAVRELMLRHETIVMVGDGINDAPALATATVGVALGARGAAVSAEAADIVVMTDDLGKVADSVEIGKRTLSIAKQSIWAGLGASGAMMVAAALGYIPPTVGAFLQEGLDVAVILNALRAR